MLRLGCTRLSDILILITNMANFHPKTLIENFLLFKHPIQAKLLPSIRKSSRLRPLRQSIFPNEPGMIETSFSTTFQRQGAYVLLLVAYYQYLYVLLVLVLLRMYWHVLHEFSSIGKLIFSQIFTPRSLTYASCLRIRSQKYPLYKHTYM